MSENKLTGAEIVIKALRDQGVDVIFGYPGGAVLPIYDALFKQNDLRHILVRHEQAAVHAAEGYARSTGKVGAVLVTSGPGATNAVTGTGDLDAVRYGRALRSRRLVDVRGAGSSYNGTYYVREVTHSIRRGEYRQSFTLTRDGRGPIRPVVAT